MAWLISLALATTVLALQGRSLDAGNTEPRITVSVGGSESSALRGVGGAGGVEGQSAGDGEQDARGPDEEELSTASHYCAGYDACPYEGRALGCGHSLVKEGGAVIEGSKAPGSRSGDRNADGLYHASDPTIAATRDGAGWACGEWRRVCARVDVVRVDVGQGVLGMQGEMRCIQVRRADSCACFLDLSEAGFIALCLDLARGVCEVYIERIGD